jgi:hypothetical protein
MRKQNLNWKSFANSVNSLGPRKQQSEIAHTPAMEMEGYCPGRKFPRRTVAQYARHLIRLI